MSKTTPGRVTFQDYIRNHRMSYDSRERIGSASPTSVPAIRQDEEIGGVGWMTFIVCVLVLSAVALGIYSAIWEACKRAASLVNLTRQQRDIWVI